jgi:hypothetical protein
VASHQVINEYVDALASRLPDHVVEELADGLLETQERLVAAGAPQNEAALTAIREFGAPAETVAAFVSQAPGRRIARLLLFTSPVVAGFWAASLITAGAWTWPVPLPAVAILGMVLVGTVALLVISATSHQDYRRTRFGIIGGLGALVVDTGMLAIVVFAAPTLVFPMAAAMAVSMARIMLTVRSLRECWN